MPYRHAHYFVLICIAVIVAGFWPTYFAVWGEVPWQFHAHGIAASLWVLMVLAQSWTPHHGQLAIHRAVGRSSLFLFPFLIGGLAAIIDVTGKRFVEIGDPVRTMFGTSFVIGLVLAIAAYVTLYFRALKYRRKVWVHSGYMLATPLILFESPFGRILNLTVPGLQIRGEGDLWLIMPAILVSTGIELLVVAALWWRFRDKARPFLVAGLFIVAQMLTMGLLVESTLMVPVLRWIVATPSAALVLGGMAIGAATSWAGWQAGKRPAAVAGVAAT